MPVPVPVSRPAEGAVPSGARTVAVVLAAGAGSRFTGDTHKLLAPLRGSTVVAWAVTHAVEAGIGPVVVVTGAADLTGTLPVGVVTLANPRWSEGQATSLQVARRWADEQGFDAMVVGLGDQPFVTPEAWRLVAAATGPLATADFDGRRTPPVRIDRSLWPDLPETGDEGARVLMRSRPDLLQAVACPGHAADIDTVEDLKPWS